MDYFTAVQTGRARVGKALEKLQEVAGASSPVLFLKMGTPEWTPVGEEELFAMAYGREDAAALVICDSDGNSKAMSSWMSQEAAERILDEMRSKGEAIYQGQVKLPL